MIHRIKRVFRWATENEFVPADIHAALTAVAGLKQVRSTAHESARVRPVDEATVTNTLPYLSRIVAAMVKLQLLTGARPGEICAMRPCDVSFGTTGVWTLRTATHKTQHHGPKRPLPLLQPYSR